MIAQTAISVLKRAIVLLYNLLLMGKRVILTVLPVAAVLRPARRMHWDL
jgi:hypothetical protein